MIKNLIFDFGGVLINLDQEAVPRGLLRFGMEQPTAELLRLSERYEKGQVSTDTFLGQVQAALPGSGREEVCRIWNETISDFPAHRLDFLARLKGSGKYRMFLLSNTNALHMQQVAHQMGPLEFDRFRGCFEGFYLSHEIGMRKPDPEIFAFVLSKNGLKAEETYFVDDTLEHTRSAAALGIRTWHFQVGVETILELEKRLV